MTDIKLDQFGFDLDMDEGDLQIVDGIEAIAQHLRMRLKMFKGEWFRNVNEGIPYFQNILKKAPFVQSVGGIFREAVQNTPGVQNIEKFTTEYDPSTRQFKVQFRARVDTGEILDFSEEFVINV